MRLLLGFTLAALGLVNVLPSDASWTVKPHAIDSGGHSESFSQFDRRSSINSENIINVMFKPTVFVKPGNDIQSLVDSNPAGTTFVIKSGVHRLQQIKPKNGSTFLGEPGAILSGAKILSDFIQEGRFWVANGQFQQGLVHGFCDHSLPDLPKGGCQFSEDLFINDQVLFQVVSLSDMTPGRWFFDYDANKIYLSDNPNGKKVETSLTRYAFWGHENNVTIKHLIIEKYANPVQEGAIHAKNGNQGPLGENWTIINNEIRFNHGVGIRISNGMKAIANRIHHNGQLGIGGAGRNMLFEHNDIAHNNTQGNNWQVEAGGVKVVKARNIIFRGNFVHHNIGPGIWADVDNINIMYEGNRLADNAGPGIFHEKSLKAVIRTNWVGRNGFGLQRGLIGAGILISASSNVDIYANTVRFNAAGIGLVQATPSSGQFGQFDLRDVFVHDNEILMRSGQTGMDIRSQELVYFTGRNIRFKKNRYFLFGNKDNFFRWMNRARTPSEWKTFGQDVNGAIIMRK